MTVIHYISISFMIYPFISDSPSENSRGGNEDSRWGDGRKLNDKDTNTDGVGVEIFRTNIKEEVFCRL